MGDASGLRCSAGPAILKQSLKRVNQASRTTGESWRPVPCSDVSLVRRYFDLQSGTIWRDLSVALRNVSGSLVDVGCGAQPYRRLLSNDVRYIGIDSVEAKTVFGYEMPDTRYYDGFFWPVDDGVADVVLATETLEHVSDPNQFLREAHRALRPGGKLLMTVPFAARWHFIPVDFWRFTPAGLSQLLAGSGFEDVEVYARGNAVTVAAYKCLALIASFVLPQAPSKILAGAMRVIGVMLLPLFVAFAVAGNVSLRFESGDDCLGYTVFARKPERPDPSIL
jgi:SAM-dependent methyltransferase